MKTLVVSLGLAALSFSAIAGAPKKCRALAEREVRYSREEAFSDCELAPNKAVYLCEVTALKGGGDASDTYLVVVNKSCSRVLRSELIGEE